jgi:hypothetical protein
MSPVIVYQHHDEATRTPDRSCAWIGEAVVDGRTYTAISRMSPANDIARQLVADGWPDCPLEIHTEGLKGALVWPSFHKAALYSNAETVAKPVHPVRWEDPAVRSARIAATLAPKQGVKAPAATSGYLEGQIAPTGNLQGQSGAVISP